MEDINYVKKMFVLVFESVKDVYGFKYNFLIDVQNQGDHLDVNVGEFDDMNLSELLQGLNRMKLKDDFFIDTISISIKHKQIKIEIKKGTNTSKMIWTWNISDQAEHLSLPPMNINQHFLGGFSQSEKLEAYHIYHNVYKLLDSRYIDSIKSIAKAEVVLIKINLQRDTIIAGNLISYVATRFKTNALFTDDSPHLSLSFQRTSKDFV